jgi:hypothetical protein
MTASGSKKSNAPSPCAPCRGNLAVGANPAALSSAIERSTSATRADKWFSTDALVYDSPMTRRAKSASASVYCNSSICTFAD